MKILIYYPNDQAQDETDKKNIVNKHKQNQVGDHLEEEVPFTLDLIYHRRQPRAAALISLLVPGFGGLGQLLLGQESKAGLLLIIEWFILMPIGIATKPCLICYLSFISWQL